ncbi:MAG: KilA-N domain-containing protein [Aeromonadaceae bacterium]
MVKLIKADFDGRVMQFNDSGWFNATAAADAMGKRVQHWLDNKETQEYIEKLNNRNSGDLNIGKSDIIETRKGRNGGTWIHPKLAVVFARWLSVDFAIWCDEQIDKIIHGDRDSIDWGMQRHASKSSNKVANEILQMVRNEQGKETKHFHYANEAKLVNFALTGKFESVDRDSLSSEDLDLLASLENRNSVLIGREVDRETRKEILCQMAADARIKKIN